MLKSKKVLIARLKSHTAYIALRAGTRKSLVCLFWLSIEETQDYPNYFTESGSTQGLAFKC